VSQWGFCPKCGKPNEYAEPFINPKTQKEVGAKVRCSDKNCLTDGYRTARWATKEEIAMWMGQAPDQTPPPQPPPGGWRPYTPPAAPAPHPNAPPTGESKDRQIARAVALKASVDMYVGAMGAGLAKDDIPEAFVIQRAETFLGWLEGKDAFEQQNGF